MLVKSWLLAIFCCFLVQGCGGGGSAPPAPVGSQEPAPAPQEPQSDSQNPAPDSQNPRIGSQEPSSNPQEPLPPVSPQSGGEAGALPGDP